MWSSPPAPHSQRNSKRSSSAPGRASSATRSIRSFTSRISASFRACLSRRDSTTIVLRLSWPPDKRVGDSLVTVYPLPPKQPRDELLQVERGRTPAQREALLTGSPRDKVGP